MADWVRDRLAEGLDLDSAFAPTTHLACGDFPNGIPPLDWSALLCGIHQGLNVEPRLSLRRTEELYFRQLHERNVHSIRVCRRPDIDSFFARLTTLAAFKTGFVLTWRPQYLANVQQEQFLPVANCELHQTKHIRLGHGATTALVDCYVFFPHLATADSGDTFLTEVEQIT